MNNFTELSRKVLESKVRKEEKEKVLQKNLTVLKESLDSIPAECIEQLALEGMDINFINSIDYEKLKTNQEYSIAIKTKLHNLAVAIHKEVEGLLNA